MERMCNTLAPPPIDAAGDVTVQTQRMLFSDIQEQPTGIFPSWPFVV